MSTNSPDYETIRQRVEKRLEPQKKLRRMWLWFFANVGLFVGYLALLSADPNNSIFVKVIKETGTYFDPATNKTETLTYTSYQTYPLVVLISVVWFFLLLAHFIQVISAYRHERRIQREVEREMNLEMERLRLQVELLKHGRGDAVDDDLYAAEKAKRTIQLSDDGELITEEPRAISRRKS